jgi:xylulokinase
MYDLQRGCWNREICNRYGINVDKLPEILFSGAPVGKVRKEVAQKLGLSNDCIVAVGGQDQKCAAFGAGISQKITSVSLGTAAAITRLLTKVESNIDDSRISCCGYVIPQTWALEGVLDTAGTCLRYVRDVFYKGETYERINQEVSQYLDVEDNVFFYPYLNGVAGKTVLEKPQGCFFGISLSTVRGAYAKAVMEGVAFQLRLILEQMHAYENSEELVLFGGGANSEIWCQIISDITALPITTLSTAESAGAGAARLAGLACQHHINPLSANKKYYPSTQKTQYYMKKYKAYFDLANKIWNG